jgi:hypothetical protein
LHGVEKHEMVAGCCACLATNILQLNEVADYTFKFNGYKLPYELKNENGKIDLWADKFLPMKDV